MNLLHLLTNIDLIWQCLTVSLGCVALWKPKGVNISKKHLYNCFANNKEGAGFAYAQNGKIHILKGFFSFKDFWKTFRDFNKFPALVHFRIATHGKIDEDNCHPFPMLGGKYAIVHNGVLPQSLHSNKKDESDTKQFAELLSTVIEMVPFGHPGFNKFLEEAIGYNKVAVMRNDGKIWIINESRGNWFHGVWYSNNTYSYDGTKYSKKYDNWPNCKTTDDMWHRLGYGTKTNPVYSSAHGQRGWYDQHGVWIKLDDETQGEISSEELDAMAEAEAADADATQEEQHVARWLALQDAKTRPKLVDGYHPHPFVRETKLLTNIVDMPVQ